MAEVSFVGPEDGEIALSGATRMRILEDGSTTSHRLGVGEITIAPHTEGPPQHRHAQHDEGFYVVSGTARFTVGQRSYDAPAGTFVMIPPGAPHTFANPGEEPAVLLNTFTPDLYVQYFRDLHDLIAAGQPLSDQALVDTMARYATVPATDSAPTDPGSADPAPGPATRMVTVGAVGPVPTTFTDRGEGRTYLLLHGGAGPQSVTPFADRFAGAEAARVVTPVHPGFAGTPRPGGLDTIGGLAALYVRLLDELDLTDVTVIGNSIGGWITAEMALLGSPRITGIVLVDAVGIEVAGHPVVDFFSLTLDEVARRSYHDPDPFRIDPAAMTAEQRAAMAGNRDALAVYGGTAMTDPGLAARLSGIKVPTLVLWGDSDQIVDTAYGRAYAAAIPGARFQLLPATGHVPQIETPAQLVRAISDFAPNPASTHPGT
jgi:pimeloyl-ACP methyl ester carboxylesterase/mannose-6-phosphate isomerase-like protein (cupin superfamily)